MDTLISYDCENDLLADIPIEPVVEFFSESMDLPENSEVSISFVSNSCIAELNESYRGKIGPTDVLSFECDNLDDGFDVCTESCSGKDSIYCLGDIVIAPDVALRQSRDFGNTFEQEVVMLLVHGLLHLCGYDHIEDSDAEVMQELQDRIISDFNKSQS